MVRSHWQISQFDNTNNGAIKGRCERAGYTFILRNVSNVGLLTSRGGRRPLSCAKTRSPANSFSICYRRYNVPISPGAGST